MNWLNVILMSKYSNAVEYDLSSAVEITIYDKFNKDQNFKVLIPFFQLKIYYFLLLLRIILLISCNPGQIDKKQFTSYSITFHINLTLWR